jgi:hypothetical protein
MCGSIVIGAIATGPLIDTLDAMVVLNWIIVSDWIAVLLVFPFLLPYVLWELLSPRPFQLHARKYTVEYCFRDAEYAQEFAVLNGAAVNDEHA